MSLIYVQGVQSTNWSHAYEMSLTPTAAISQPLAPNFLPLQRPMTGEATALVDESNSNELLRRRM